MRVLPKNKSKLEADPKQEDSQPDEPRYWRVLHDVELRAMGYKPPIREDLPEVFMLAAKPMKMTADIQKMCFELLQYGMKKYDAKKVKKQFRKVYECHRAFNNNKGFECKNNKPHGPYADFVNNENLNQELPRFDKVRVCGGATLKGEVVGDKLKIETLRGAVDIDELLVRPWLFFEAVNQNKKHIYQFPQAAPGDKVYIPLISPIDVYLPLAMLESVSEIADPYYVKR